MTRFIRFQAASVARGLRHGDEWKFRHALTCFRVDGRHHPRYLCVTHGTLTAITSRQKLGLTSYGGLHKWGYPQNRWFITENPNLKDDFHFHSFYMSYRFLVGAPADLWHLRPAKWGYPNSWRVYFIENATFKWMIWGTTHFICLSIGLYQNLSGWIRQPISILFYLSISTPA